MSDELPDILKPETKEHYQEDAAGYFRNVGSRQISGISADDLAAARPHLPSKEVEAKYADRVERAADKTKRSGARVNNSSNVPAIFFDSLKNHSELIDEFTPGKLQEPEEVKPPDQQIAPTGFFEKAEAVVEGFCLDCQQAPDSKYVLGVTICTEEDTQKLTAMGIGYGATVLYTICHECFEAAKELARDKTPLVLVFDGGVLPDSEIALARKYNFPVNLHEGVEKSYGQWQLVKRAERLMDTLWNYLIAQNQIPSSKVFRNKAIQQ